jgi:hypothetical protein
VSSPQSDDVETSRSLIVGACGAKTTTRKRLPFSYFEQACEPRVRYTPTLLVLAVPRNRVRGGLFCLLSPTFGGLLSAPEKRVIYGVEGEPHSNQVYIPERHPTWLPFSPSVSFFHARRTTDRTGLVQYNKVYPVSP